MTARQAIHAAADSLRTNPHLADAAQRDAEFLLLHTLGIARATLFAYPDRSLAPAEEARYEQAIARRQANEPVQYITGEQEFYGLALRVTPAVLIPRPETEHLVEAVLERLPADRALRILDVGTGSGAIAIALALHLPRAQVVAVDISPAALAIASANASTHHVADRIRLVESNLLDAVQDELFDAIVSNPPYIPESDLASLQPQVRDFEPAEALFAAEDGLAIYKQLIPQAHAALRHAASRQAGRKQAGREPDGLLALEIGYGQRDRIAGLLSQWSNVVFVADLQGIPRVVLADVGTS